MKAISVLSHCFSTPPNPAEIADMIRAIHSSTITSLRSVVAHPRSLARPHAAWRPPVIHLPPIHKQGIPRLTATVTRYRADATACLHVFNTGAGRAPAYVVLMRLSDPTGQPVDHRATEAWIRALIPDYSISSVHELARDSASTFCWVVDGSFNPLPSLPSILQPRREAA